MNAIGARPLQLDRPGVGYLRSVPGYASLFWRLFIPNATVIVAACAVLFLEPANGRIPVLVGGSVLLMAVNLVLIRRTVQPLVRLAAIMQRVDPLVQGERLPLPRQHSEVRIVAEAFNEMLDRLESERQQSGTRILREREAERRRISAELHDQIGQVLTAIALQLDRLEARAPSDELRVECASAREGVLAALQDVRRLASELRPEALDALGLVPALRTLTSQLAERTGMRIDRTLATPLPTLSAEQELVVYRVAQEGLTNALRHAGATRIDVELEGRGTGVALAVRDDGCGIAGATHRPAGGIRTMQERALSVGADLHVGPGNAGGTEVRLILDGAPATR